MAGADVGPQAADVGHRRTLASKTARIIWALRISQQEKKVAAVLRRTVAATMVYVLLVAICGIVVGDWPSGQACRPVVLVAENGNHRANSHLRDFRS